MKKNFLPTFLRCPQNGHIFPYKPRESDSRANECNEMHHLSFFQLLCIHYSTKKRFACIFEYLTPAGSN